jgi:hypothetical protein
MPVIRTTDNIMAGEFVLGTITSIIGPVGITEVTIALNNDTYALTEFSHPEGEEASKNETVVRVSGGI